MVEFKVRLNEQVHLTEYRMARTRQNTYFPLHKEYPSLHEAHQTSKEGPIAM